MILWSVLTDENLRERFSYPDSAFPMGVWTDDYKRMKNHMLDYHWHSDFEMGYLISGELDYSLADKTVHLNMGEGIFINSNTLHMAKPTHTEDETIMAVIDFQPTILTQSEYTPFYAKYFHDIVEQNLAGCKIDPKTQFGASVIYAMKDIYETWEKTDNYEILCLSALCRVWNYTLEYISHDGNDLVKKTMAARYENEMKCMISYIQSHYPENIAIDDIAGYANISRSECFRCFKRITSKTPVEYINEYRLSCAANLLSTTNEPVTSICLKCGFSNPSYFGKLFRKAYGVNPLTYRKEHSS